MNKAFEKILWFIDEQIKIEESIAKSKNEGHPITHQYGANCMNVIKNFVHQLEEEYNRGHFGCNSNGEHEKCNKCSLTDCKMRNTIWFCSNDNNGWIPCIERLPEEVGLYLVCYDNPNCYPKIVWFGGKFTKESHVIAWQPLPEPYRERDNNGT